MDINTAMSDKTSDSAKLEYEWTRPNYQRNSLLDYLVYTTPNVSNGRRITPIRKRFQGKNWLDIYKSRVKKSMRGEQVEAAWLRGWEGES